MSDPAGQDSAPDQPTAPPETETPGDGTSSKQPEPVHLQPPQSLRRLRERVETAARELERLRKENAALTKRIEKLETRPPVDVDDTLLTLDEDPEALREKIEGFIEAIDRYLAQEAD